MSLILDYESRNQREKVGLVPLTVIYKHNLEKLMLSVTALGCVELDVLIPRMK